MCRTKKVLSRHMPEANLVAPFLRQGVKKNPVDTVKDVQSRASK
jgi:hypothetical protein